DQDAHGRGPAGAVGPSSPRTAPCSTETSTPAKASLRPKVLRRPWDSMSAVMRGTVVRGADMRLGTDPDRSLIEAGAPRSLVLGPDIATGRPRRVEADAVRGVGPARGRS